MNGPGNLGHSCGSSVRGQLCRSPDDAATIRSFMDTHQLANGTASQGRLNHTGHGPALRLDGETVVTRQALAEIPRYGS
jgi:hypothetical protein